MRGAPGPSTTETDRALTRAARRAMRWPGRPVRTDAGATVTVLDDLVELEQLRTEWRSLDADIDGPASQLDWILAYGATSGRDRRSLQVVTLRLCGELAGVVPLVRVRGAAPRLELLIFDVGTLLYRDLDALAALVTVVLAVKVPLTLDLLPADSPSARELARRCPGTTTRRWSEHAGGPSLAIDRTVTDATEQLRRSKRRDLQRRRRRAAEQGLEVEVTAPGGDLHLLSRSLNEYVELERAGWKGTAGTALANEPDRWARLWHYLSARQVRHQVRVARLLVGGGVAAIDIAVVTGSAYWSVKATYDERLSTYAPGHLLTAFTLDHARAVGLQRYEFMGDHEPYKQAWSDARPLWSLTRYPVNPAGVVAATAAATTKVARVVHDRVPARRAAAPLSQATT